jgi:hypothetical protein
MAVARPLPHDQRFQAILDGGEHGVMLKVGRHTADLMVAIDQSLHPLMRRRRHQALELNFWMRAVLPLSDA